LDYVLLHIEDRLLGKKRPDRSYGKEGVYSLFTPYLLPMYEGQSKTIPAARLLQNIKRNLDEFKMVGVLENNKASISMLADLLDSHHNIDEKYWYHFATDSANIAAVTPKGRFVEGRGMNQSNIVTSRDVLRYLESKPHKLLRILQVLEFDYDIFEYAVETHQRLCGIVTERRPKLFDFYIKEMMPEKDWYKKKDIKGHWITIKTKTVRAFYRLFWLFFCFFTFLGPFFGLWFPQFFYPSPHLAFNFPFNSLSIPFRFLGLGCPQLLVPHIDFP
jgi:hypothetical protein